MKSMPYHRIGQIEDSLQDKFSLHRRVTPLLGLVGMFAELKGPQLEGGRLLPEMGQLPINLEPYLRISETLL